MRLLRRPMLGSGGPARLIGVSATTSAGTSHTVALPTGTQVGDVAVLFAEYATAAPTVLSGWTVTYRNWYYHTFLATRVLASTTGINVDNLQSGSVLYLMVFRDCAAATLKTDQGTSTTAGPTIALAGFAPNAVHRGLVTIASDRDPDVTPTFPTGHQAQTLHASTSFSVRGAFLPSNYSGGTVTVSGLQGASDYAQHGYLVELT